MRFAGTVGSGVPTVPLRYAERRLTSVEPDGNTKDGVIANLDLEAGPVAHVRAEHFLGRQAIHEGVHRAPPPPGAS